MKHLFFLLIGSAIQFIFIGWLFAVCVFFYGKTLYYYPAFDLYLYLDGGIVGNRTLLLGQNLNSMNTLLRYDSPWDGFCYYIGKESNQFYIYWPEDTIAEHYRTVRDNNSDGSFSFQMIKKKYNPYLREYASNCPHFSLITYQHQNEEKWIESFEAWENDQHWGSSGQIRINHKNEVTSYYSREVNEFPINRIPLLGRYFLPYVRFFFIALDCKSITFLLLGAILISLLYYLKKLKKFCISGDNTK